MLTLVSRLREVYRRFAMVPALLLSARFHRYRANNEGAKDCLLRASTLVPTCFKAHLQLGAIYLGENDFYLAKREFLLARELNPGKFRRLYPLITGESGDVNINLFYFPDYTDRDLGGDAPENFLREFIGDPLGENGPAGDIRYGDFSSYREFRRFQEMGPFRQEEVERVDWADLERRLRGNGPDLPD